MDSHIPRPYQIADHHSRISWLYNKNTTGPNRTFYSMRVSLIEFSITDCSRLNVYVTLFNGVDLVGKYNFGSIKELEAIPLNDFGIGSKQNFRK